LKVYIHSHNVLLKHYGGSHGKEEGQEKRQEEKEEGQEVGSIGTHSKDPGHIGWGFCYSLRNFPGM
jgi:hypothetical protein